MPRIRKKNPAVRNVPTFKKKKVKVGRSLPHANSTNTEIKSKKITITEQNVINELNISIIDKNSGKPNNISIKSIDVAISQLGHHNENISKTAICGIDSSISFLQKPDLLLHCCKIICPLLLAIIYEVEGESDKQFNSIMSRFIFLYYLINYLILFLFLLKVIIKENNISSDLRSTFSALKRCSFINSNKKLRMKLDLI
ncbi:hypothetical protein Mgra_00005955 [Meloidogyne graminicola]|uniref:Uncharacterized protein n=1 Tax=Meloidogyne graminicola TaxID=189291 RepID=A0A8S9ZN65_9BILA|nr:hypothetical protein Mgra_00005955 [Meloidogyne graminicola]